MRKAIPVPTPGSRARARRRRRIAHPRRSSWHPTSSAFWPASRRARASAKTSWCGSSRRAAAPSMRCARPPTGSGHGLAGPAVTYVVNRNINYTNVCYFRCQFCAFSKGKMSENLRGRPYDLPLEEIVRRVREAWERGATEVCLQGGIHPDYTGETYLSICRAIKEAEPRSTSMPSRRWKSGKAPRRWDEPCPTSSRSCRRLDWGSLPGTAAEILDDEVRAVICPDKDRYRSMALGHGGRAWAGPAQHRHDHVRPCGFAASLGAPPVTRPRLAGAHGRLHRIRAASLRRDGGAALSQGPRSARADLARSCAHARGGEARAQPGHR